MFSKFIKSQVWLSKQFDKLLPAKFRLDGMSHFVKSFIPQYLDKGLTIYDVGGGKSPYLTAKRKKELNAKVIGLDIDEEELNAARPGVYDKTITGDIAQYQGKGDADLVFCRALLEHVEDVDGAFSSMSSILKKGGTALIFVPSRNALFARLNLVLPESVKRKLLSKIHSHDEGMQGFPAYYNKCTPRQFAKLADKHGFKIQEEKYYYYSNYFAFFFPIYVLWRLWVLVYYFLFRKSAAESFSLALKKQ